MSVVYIAGLILGALIVCWAIWASWPNPRRAVPVNQADRLARTARLDPTLDESFIVRSGATVHYQGRDPLAAKQAYYRFFGSEIWQAGVCVRRWPKANT